MFLRFPFSFLLLFVAPSVFRFRVCFSFSLLCFGSFLFLSSLFLLEATCYSPRKEDLSEIKREIVVNV